MKKSLKYFYLILLAPSVALADPLITDPKGEPATTAQAVTDFINNAQTIVLSAAGGIAVAMIIYGGLILVTAGGNEEKIGKGKKILTFAIGGLLLIFFATFLIKFFIIALGGDVK